jgi:hypothetical protein
MKKLTLTSLLIVITLAFSSCNVEDDSLLLEETSSERLLKSFNINKNASGEYSLDYELGKGAASDNILDEKTNTNNIYLYSSENMMRSNHNENLNVQDGKLKVAFNNTSEKTRHTITILDDDIQMRDAANEYLESYEISGNGDGTYNLNFTVKNGVGVDFVYDDDRKVYEIHLNQNDDASQSEFLQTFTKEQGIALNIQFFDNSSATDRTASSSSMQGEPVIIVENGESGGEEN